MLIDLRSLPRRSSFSSFSFMPLPRGLLSVPSFSLMKKKQKIKKHSKLSAHLKASVHQHSSSELCENSLLNQFSASFAGLVAFRACAGPRVFLSNAHSFKNTNFSILHSKFLIQHSSPVPRPSFLETAQRLCEKYTL